MEDSIFLKEWLATDRTPNQLPISAVCNSRCLFCSNHLNPFPIKKNIFRDLEDVKLQLSIMPPQFQEPIRMSDSLPGRISEGEAFLHPKFFEILELVRRRFLTNRLCFTTNGSMLDEPFLRELSRFRPIEITVSMHSSRPPLWARIFGKNERAARRAINSLQLIKKFRMELEGTIVPLPRICGWDDLELTYANFVAHGAKSMILYWPGYTVRTPPAVLKDLECPLEEFTDFAKRMRAAHKIPVDVFPDMDTPLSVPVKKIMGHTLRGNLKNRGGPYRQVLWLASESAYERLSNLVEQQAASFSNRHRVIPVKNMTYGGNIRCAGLLMVNDLVLAGQMALEQQPETELILVPATPFDTLSRDLQGTPVYKVAEELKKTVWLVSPEGSFTSLLSRVFVQAGDLSLAGLHDSMKLFNLAWQDDAHLDQSLELVDSYPLKTTAGSLGREGLQELIRQERRKLPDNAKPLTQRFEVLDKTHALCLERWLTKETATTFNRWTFLVKRDSRWKIEYVACGRENDL